MSSAQNTLQPKLRLKDRRRRLLWVQSAVVAFIFFLLLVAFFYLARLPSLSISNVEVAGTNVADATVLKTLVEEKLGGTYGLLVPKRNALFAPRSDITESLLTGFPVIQEVRLIQNDPQTLEVVVVERTPAALWCAPQEEGTSATCFSMDAHGFIYMQSESTDPYVRYSGALDGEPIGNRFLGGNFADLHVFVTKTAETIGHAPESVAIESNNDASIAFVDGGELKFVITDDSQATLDNIASVFASQRFKSKQSFEYADFRYGNKIYVKFIEE